MAEHQAGFCLFFDFSKIKNMAADAEKILLPQLFSEI